VELRQLRYFLTAAELRHFGRAAERLHVVQPAVSQQIARLERELGLQLFDRTHRRVTLTADGEAFLPHARRVLQAVDRATRAAAELAVGGTGLLRVGTSEGLGRRLEGVLTEFRRRRPQATVELISGRTPDKLAAISTGDLDVAFVRAARPSPGVRLHHLFEEPLLAAVPAHGRPADGEPIDLADLAGLPLARTPRSENPGFHDLVERACGAAGFSPLAGPAFTTVQDVLTGHVAAGRCWTLLFASTAVLVPGNVLLAPTRPQVLVPTQLAVRDSPPRPLVAAFLATALSATDAHGGDLPTA